MPISICCSILFDGTWEQIKDKFLLSCGDVYQNGVIGGESTHQLTNITTSAGKTTNNDEILKLKKELQQVQLENEI